LNPGCAQLQRLFNTGYRECIGIRRQRLGTLHGAMPIGVGLEHGKGAAGSQAFSQLVVVAQGVKVDEGVGWAQAGFL